MCCFLPSCFYIHCGWLHLALNFMTMIPSIDPTPWILFDFNSLLLFLGEIKLFVISTANFNFRETFPYYKSWDDRWKNSVRHNLSINPYFRKGTKARQGSGHLWTVNKSDENSRINNWVSITSNLLQRLFAFTKKI